MQPEWSTFGGRLRWAIAQLEPKGRQRGLRLFQRRILESAEASPRRIPGVTLQSISTYLRGEVKPAHEFTEEAARLLGVHPGWLFSGLGHPTLAHAQAAAAAAGAGSDRQAVPLGVRLSRAILKRIGTSQRAGGRGVWLTRDKGGANIPERAAEPEPVPHWAAPIAEVWLRLHMADAGTFLDGTEPERSPEAEAIIATLRHPFDALGLDPALMTEDERGEYILAMVPPLLWLVNEKQRQRASAMREKHDTPLDAEASERPHEPRAPKPTKAAAKKRSTPKPKTSLRTKGRK